MCKYVIDKDRIKRIVAKRKEEQNKLVKNSMLELYPELEKEWDYEKNDEEGINIRKVSYGSDRKAWWKCDNGHSWNTSIKHRTRGSGCPYCSKVKVSVGETDFKTTNPKEYEWIIDKNKVEGLSKYSTVKLDWKCPNCNSIIKDKTVHAVTKSGLSCSHCADGVSYPEKFMSNLLKQLNIEFIAQYSPEWSNHKRYDFYLPEFNTIIEVHGEQHSGEGFENLGGRSLEEEIANDDYKRKLAIINNINRYIEIDCQKSELEYIKNNILRSEIIELLDLNNVDWTEIDRKSQKSNIVIACDYWNNGIKNTREIGELMNLHFSTIINYLKKGSELNLTDYNPDDNRSKTISKKVIQISLDFESIKIWNSTKEVATFYNTNSSTVSEKCRNSKIFEGYLWMYHEEYIKRLKIK